ncbi:MAG: manganese transporter permease [Planctomycetota bacterium]|nr:MAG: manganese transporter permease [Planctomycetota bacterium]
MSAATAATVRWAQFVRERFPPAAYLPMASLFVAGNGLLAAALHPAAARSLGLRLALAFALALSYFLRLRLFDEIKDLEVDRRLNPDRPLARGLLTLREVGFAIGALTVFELALTATLGRAVLATHTLAVGYSYLMFREFFVGRWLRPHLTTYAVTHTVSSGLLGLSVASVVTGLGLPRLGPALWALALANWALFNVFEFARKSFAASEERDGADSYTRRFGPRGAVALTGSQLVLALAVLAWIAPHSAGAVNAVVLAAEGLLAAAVLLVATAFARNPSVKRARRYRAAAGLFIVFFFTVLSIGAARALP